jgi:hypothetical protein
MSGLNELSAAITAQLDEVGASRTVTTNFETEFEDFTFHGSANQSYAADGTRAGSNLEIAITRDDEDDLILIDAPHRDPETGDTTQWSVVTLENYAPGDIAARLGLIAVEFVSNMLDATHPMKKNKPGLGASLQSGYDVLAHLLDEDFDAIERESRFKLVEVNSVLVATDRYADAIADGIESTTLSHHINVMRSNALPLAYEGQAVDLRVVFKRVLPDEDPIGSHLFEVTKDIDSGEEPLGSDHSSLVRQGIHYAIGEDNYSPKIVDWTQYPERSIPNPSTKDAQQADIERFIEIVSSAEVVV